MVTFKETELGYETTIQLNAWRRSPSAPISPLLEGEVRRDGLIKVILDRDDVKTGPATAYDMECVKFLVDHDAAIAKSLLKAVLAEYPRIRDDAMSVELPNVETTAELLSLIALDSVCLGFLKSTAPYIGFAFECAWDIEHGFGVMMHGATPIEIGDSPTAFDAGIPETHHLTQNLLQYLRSRLDPKHTIAPRAALDRYRTPHQPDILIAASAGPAVTAIEVRGFFDNPRRNESDLVVYDAMPHLTSVLWICEGPPMAVTWRRETSDHPWEPSKVSYAGDICSIPTLGLSFALLDLYDGLET